jgi:hypothetical protein
LHFDQCGDEKALLHLWTAHDLAVCEEVQGDVIVFLSFLGGDPADLFYIGRQHPSGVGP